jgi:hypothetical protein
MKLSRCLERQLKNKSSPEQPNGGVDAGERQHETIRSTKVS